MSARTQSAEHYLDRSDAVNLARNVLRQRDDPEITNKGIAMLAQAVIDMDEELRRLYELRNMAKED